MKSFLSLVRYELENTCGKNFESAFLDIWNIYEQDMLINFPYIGGDHVSGTKNLTQAYMPVAMGEYLKRYCVPKEKIGLLMTTAYERRMMKMPFFVRKIMGKMFKNPKLLNKMFLKKDAKNKSNAKKIPAASKQKHKYLRNPVMISATTSLYVLLQILQKSMGMRNICHSCVTLIM